MRQLLFVFLLVLAGLSGYVVRPLNAQANPFPFTVGDTVQFTMPDNAIRNCRVEAIQGMFVLCGPRSPHQMGDYWYNVAALTGVEVKGKR